MEHSDTPRTDAVAAERNYSYKWITFGKQLERELRTMSEMHGDALVERNRLRAALDDLVTRCDGAEGVRPDGSNIPTAGAHAALGHFDTQED